MRTPPDIWKKANNERFTRLGALVTRKKLLLLDLSGVDQEIDTVQAEILAIERTSDMAAEVKAEAAKGQHVNGDNESDRAT